MKEFRLFIIHESRRESVIKDIWTVIIVLTPMVINHFTLNISGVNVVLGFMGLLYMLIVSTRDKSRHMLRGDNIDLLLLRAKARMLKHVSEQRGAAEDTKEIE